MDKTDESGKPVRFNLKVHKRSTGELIEANDVVMLSYYHRQGRLNIKFPNGEIRKIYLVLITQINGKETYL